MSMDALRAALERTARAGTTAVTESVHIARLERTGPPEFETSGSQLVLLAQGEKRLAVGDRVHDYRPGDALLAPLDLPVTGHFTRATWDQPALGVSMRLQPAVIADLLLDPAASRIPGFGRGAPPAGIAVFPVWDELVEAVTRLVALAERPLDLPVLAPLVEREIHWLLLRSPHGAVVRQLGVADSGLTRVGHAVRWLRDHYTETVRVDELARMSAMSPSAFHRAFQQVTELSPIQFQKQLRLQEARVRLIADSTDVAGVAHGVGYESASQFSRDYRARFGAPPLRDAARLRESATAG